MRDMFMLKRGTLEKMPSFKWGELGYVTDTNELYIGTESGVNTTLNTDGGDISDTLKGKILFKRGEMPYFSTIEYGEPVLCLDEGCLIVGIGNNDFLTFKNNDEFVTMFEILNDDLDKKMNVFDKISAKQLVFDTDAEKIGLVHLKKEVLDAMGGALKTINFELADYSVTGEKLAYQSIDSRHLIDDVITNRKILDREITFSKLSKELQKKIYQIDEQASEIARLKEDVAILKRLAGIQNE